MHKLALAFSLCVTPAYSQILSFGLKAGVPVTDAYMNGQVSNGAAGHSNDRYIVGPTAEIHFPFHLSFEVDALYRRSSFYVIGGESAGIPNGTFPVNDWQVPFLAKYEIPTAFGIVRPFADAGAVYRYVSGNASYPPTHQNIAGIAVGGGVSVKILHIRLTSEIRYTHWIQNAFTFDTGFVASTSNQADCLVGFTF